METTTELQENYDRTATELQQNYRTTTQVPVLSTSVKSHTTTAGGDFTVLSNLSTSLSRATTVDVVTTTSTTMTADCDCECNGLPLIILSATTAVGFFLWFLTLIIVVCWKRNGNRERPPRYKKESSSSSKVPQNAPPVRKAPTREDSKRVIHESETTAYFTRSSIKDMAAEKPNRDDYDRPPGLKKKKIEEDVESVDTTGIPEPDDGVYIRNVTTLADDSKLNTEPPVVHKSDSQRFSQLLTNELKLRQGPIGSEAQLPSHSEYEECSPIT